MGYTLLQIGEILLKADRTMYKVGSIAYDDMFNQLDEALDYNRDIIYIYKKAVEYADQFYVGTEKLDTVVEKLGQKIAVYDYGQLTPIYSDATIVNAVIPTGSVLNDLNDVTITNLQDNQILRYSASLGQWINIGAGSAVRSSQAFTATLNQTVFVTSSPFTVPLLDVFLNGVRLNGSNYSTFGNYTITLYDGCLADDILDVTIYDPSTSIVNSSLSSVGISMPSGFTVSNSPLTSNGVIAITGSGTTAQYLRGDGTLGTFPSFTGYVPYTGATSNVDLGEYQIRAGQVEFDQTPTGTAGVGVMRWNDADGTVDLGLKGGNVTLQVGQEQVLRVVNKTGADLLESQYKAVRIRLVSEGGSQGQRLAVVLAQGNNDPDSTTTIGIVTENIDNNQEGFITTSGEVRGINTTGSLQGETWADGDIIYLSPTVPGGITIVKPIAPNHMVVLGYVIYAHAINGKIFTKVDNGYELGELHDVYVPTPSNNDGIFWNTANSRYQNNSIAGVLGYTPTSGSGVTGQVAYWNGTNSQTGSNKFTWDNSIGLLTIKSEDAASQSRGFVNEQYNNGVQAAAMIFRKARGTISSPANVLASDLVGAFSFSARVNGAFTSDRALFGANMATSTGMGLYFNAGSSDGIYTPALYIHPTGNVVVNGGGSIISGGTLDGGQRLQVYGDTLLRGSVATSAATALTVQNSASTNLFRVRNDGYVFFGTQDTLIYPTADGSNPSTSGRGLVIATNAASQTGTGALKVVGNYTSALGNDYGVWVSHTFTNIAGGTATHNGLLLNQTINQTGGANGITRGLYINPTLTSAFDFRAIETTAGNVLFGSNFFWDNTNNRLGIGTNAPTEKIHINGNQRIGLSGSTGYYISWGQNEVGSTGDFARIQGIRTSGVGNQAGHLTFQTKEPSGGTAPTERLRITDTGSILVGGTTDSGQRLQVYGSVKFDAGSDTNGFYWDNTNKRLGIGTNAPSFGLHVLGVGRFESSSGAGRASIQSSSDFGFNSLSQISQRAYFYGYITSNQNVSIGIGGNARGNTAIQAFNYTTNVATSLSLNYYGGNVIIGDYPSDAGQRLQVFGDAFIKGSGATFATTALSIQNSAGTGLLSLSNGGELFLFGANNTLIQPTDTNPSSPILTGRNTLFYNYNASSSASIGSYIFSGVNFTQQTGNNIVLNILKGIAPSGGTGTFALLSLSSTINQQGGANGITRGLYVNPTLTAAADWRSIEWSNNSGWGLYGAGTSANYLGGRLAIGSVTANSIYALNVEGIINISRAVGNPALSFNNTAAASSSIAYLEALSSEFHIYAHTGRSISFTSGAGVSRTMTLTAAGRLLLGTVSEGTFLLDVNGTARVSDTFTAGTNTFTNKLNAQFGTFGIQSSAINNGFLADNVFYNGSSWTRTNTGYGYAFQFYNGQVLFQGVNTGTGNFTANNTMKVDYAGNFLLGQNLSATPLDFTNAKLRFTNNGRLLLGGIGESTYTLDVLGITRIKKIDNNTGNIAEFVSNNELSGIAITYEGVVAIGSSTNGDVKFTTKGSGVVTTSNPLVVNNSVTINSTTTGFLPPRMTTTQKTSISTPAAGLQVYDTTLNQMSYYNGTTWVNF